jgi:hypothetical protein
MTWVCYTVVNALSYLGSKSLAKAAVIASTDKQARRIEAIAVG